MEPDAGTRHSGQLDGNVALEVGEQGVFLNEYAIGKGADVFTDGSGRLIKAGTKINFQFHLHASGTETPTNVALGLKLYPKGYTPKHVITSLTVVFTLLALFLFGGFSVRNFALALLIGIISGTYSSIFNASQIVSLWQEVEDRVRHRRLAAAT